LVELELIPRLERAPADLIVVALGVNDTTKLTPRAKWRKALYQIVLRVREKTSCPILFASLPPMEHFRALPQPLRVMLGARARMLDDDIARVTKASPGAHHHRAELKLEPDYLASDGFHPSELGYALWGAQLAKHAARLVASEEQARRDVERETHGAVF
jgi:lysophospholipase L1-like esterase